MSKIKRNINYTKKIRKNVKFIIHVGPPKTGTTALQKFMLSNKEVFLKKGILYPGELENHYHFQTLFSENPHALIQVQSSKDINENIDNFKKNFKFNFEKELKNYNVNTVIISSEFFMSMSNQEMKELYKYIREFSNDVEGLYYVRNPNNQYLSATFQLIRNGRLSGDVNLTEQGVSLYEPPGESIFELNKIFEEKLNLRYYDENKGRDFNIVVDFINYLNVDSSDLIMPIQKENKRLSLETVAIISYLNKIFPQFDRDGNYISSASRDWMIESIIDSSTEAADSHLDEALSQVIYNSFLPSLEIIRNISPETHDSVINGLLQEIKDQGIKRISVNDISTEVITSHLIRALKIMADRTLDQNIWAHHERDRMTSIKKDILELIDRY